MSKVFDAERPRWVLKVQAPQPPWWRAGDPTPWHGLQTIFYRPGQEKAFFRLVPPLMQRILREFKRDWSHFNEDTARQFAIDDLAHALEERDGLLIGGRVWRVQCWRGDDEGRTTALQIGVDRFNPHYPWKDSNDTDW